MSFRDRVEGEEEDHQLPSLLIDAEKEDKSFKEANGMSPEQKLSSALNEFENRP